MHFGRDHLRSLATQVLRLRNPDETDENIRVMTDGAVIYWNDIAERIASKKMTIEDVARRMGV